MKKSVLFFLSLGIGVNAWAQSPKGIQSFEGMQPSKESRSEILARPYTQPGIIANRGGNWIGSDHLFNLTREIGIEVEVIAPQGTPLPFTTESIKTRISELFRQEGLTPIPRGNTDISALQQFFSEFATLDPDELVAQAAGPSKIERPPLKPPPPKKTDKEKQQSRMIQVPKMYTPLPFYHILIMINPIEKGYVAYVAARLFESIDIKRSGVELDEQTAFQAITWERQQLLLTSRDDLVSQLNMTVDEMTREFINRFRYFQQLRYPNQ